MDKKTVDASDFKIVIKNARNVLSKLPMDELLSYRTAVGIVLEYYVNLAEANKGEYDDFKKDEYEKALKDVNRYKELYQIVFEIIKNKVDNI